VTDSEGVLVFCEVAEGRLAAITTELLAAGRKIAQELGQRLDAVIIGSQVTSLASEAIACGADRVFVADDPSLRDYLTDPYLTISHKVVRDCKPAVILLGQTPAGRDLAPRLAFRLESAVALDCVLLAIDPGSRRLMMTKPVYGGNAQAVQVCQCNPQIATLRIKAVSPAIKDSNRTGEIFRVAIIPDSAPSRTRLLERKIEAAAGIKLEDAKVIVTGGRGIGGPEGFKQLGELAGILKGAVGASRPACDNKWVPDNYQVGLTGKIVSPDLYIAVAVSGSSQHLSGCSGSRVIVAINKDPDANIFKVAHFGVVADWKKAIPAFTAKTKELLQP
jgi:electron transfer flavoprotein alpha subunit